MALFGKQNNKASNGFSDNPAVSPDPQELQGGEAVDSSTQPGPDFSVQAVGDSSARAVPGSQPVGNSQAQGSDSDVAPQIPQQGQPSAAPSFKAARKAKRAQKRLRKMQRKSGVVRIDDLEQAIASEDLRNMSDEAIVSMYLPKRRMQRLGAALLRLSNLQKALIVLALLLCTLFAFAFMQQSMGNFTINLNRLELFRYGVAIADEPNFNDATARLQAEVVSNGTNIAADDLPDNLDSIDGSHNGKNYVAYTFYIRNAGKTDLNYSCKVKIASASKGVEKAARVKVWKNGQATVYAAAASNGGAEQGCTSFQSDDTVCTYEEESFLVGNVDKYTVAIWLDGDDPECTDDIVGGAVEFAMDFDTLDHDDSNLFVKFVQDIADTLTGTDPISSSGNDAPDYYNQHQVTWDTRRNQENSPVNE